MFSPIILTPLELRAGPMQEHKCSKNNTNNKKKPIYATKHFIICYIGQIRIKFLVIGLITIVHP